MTSFEKKYGSPLTVPNILSYVRILLIPVFIFTFLDEYYIASAIILFISGLTDCFDGILARKLNQITPLGKLLDPLADKLTLLSVVICLGIIVNWIILFVIIFVIKDLLMLVGGSILVKKGLVPSAAKWYGKAGTFMFYVSVCLIVVLKILEYDNTDAYMIVTLLLLSATAGTMIFALAKYSTIFFDILKKGKSSKEARKP